MKFFYRKPEVIPFLRKDKSNQHCGKALRNDCCKCNSGNVHPKSNYKKEIKQQIYYSCGKKNVERALSVAFCTEKSTSKVVYHRGGNSAKVNLKVFCGKIKHFLRCLHHTQEKFCASNSKYSKQNAGKNAQEHCRMNRLLKATFFPCTKVVCCNNIRSDRKPLKQIYKQVYEGTCRAYSRKRIVTGKTPYNNNVRRIKKQLKYA